MIIEKAGPGGQFQLVENLINIPIEQPGDKGVLWERLGQNLTNRAISIQEKRNGGKKK